MSPDDPRHGTEAGHEQHVRDGDDPRTVCVACYEGKLKAARRRSKRKTMGHRYTVPADRARQQIMVWREGGASFGDIADHTGVESGQIWQILNGNCVWIYTRTERAIVSAKGWPVTSLGITRRVRALSRLGWSLSRIAEACGVHHDTIVDIRTRQHDFLARKVRDGVLAGYGALSMRLPAPTVQQEKAGVTRARNYSTKMGWPAPLAWIDIDDPNEQPTIVEVRGPGRPPVAPAMVENFDWLVSQGESEEHAASRLGVQLATITDYRRDLAKQAS